MKEGQLFLRISPKRIKKKSIWMKNIIKNQKLDLLYRSLRVSSTCNESNGKYKRSRGLI
jgi:hypothetical protein